MDVMLTGSDLVRSLFGDLAIVSDDDDIIQTAINNIKTKYGEMELHPEFGNTAFTTRMKLSDTNMVSVENSCRIAILQDVRVSKVSRIKAIKSTDIYGQCDINFTLVTTDGKVLDSGVSINIV